MSIVPDEFQAEDHPVHPVELPETETRKDWKESPPTQQPGHNYPCP